MRKDWIKGLLKVDFGFGANMLMAAAATAILTSVAFDILDREAKSKDETSGEYMALERIEDQLYQIYRCISSEKGSENNV